MARRPTIPGLFSNLRTRPRQVATDSVYITGGGSTGGSGSGTDPNAVHVGDSAALDSVLFSERSDPPAPAVNKAILYARDNGSGKTQLCLRFHTGAIQILSTEP